MWRLKIQLELREEFRGIHVLHRERLVHAGYQAHEETMSFLEPCLRPILKIPHILLSVPISTSEASVSCCDLTWKVVALEGRDCPGWQPSGMPW